jgi:nitrate reductase cytochrome c-type subunit
MKTHTNEKKYEQDNEEQREEETGNKRTEKNESKKEEKSYTPLAPLVPTLSLDKGLDTP